MKEDINYIMRRQQSNMPSAPATCHVFVKCIEPCSVDALPSLLGCGIVKATQLGVSQLQWKVKIHKICLLDALNSSCSTHLVRIWKNNLSWAPSRPASSPAPSTDVSKTISVVTWNCRGYLNSTPYLLNLISGGVDTSKNTGYGRTIYHQ